MKKTKSYYQNINSILSNTTDLFNNSLLNKSLGLCKHSNLNQNLKLASFDIFSECYKCSNNTKKDKTVKKLTKQELILKLFEKPQITSYDIIPNTIYLSYTDDLNILMIHEAIKSKVAIEHVNAQTNIMNIENRRKQLKDEIKNFSKSEYLEKIKKLEEEEEKEYAILNYHSWNIYISKAVPILIKYLKYKDKSIDRKNDGIVSFLSQNIEFELDDEMEHIYNTEEDIKLNRIKLIEQYLNIARIILDIKSFSLKTEKLNSCKNCKSDINSIHQNVNLVDDFGTHVCECGIESTFIARNASYKDSTRIDTGSKNSYNDLMNFQKRLDAFEGKQKTQPPILLKTQVEEYLDLHKDRLLRGRTCEEIRKEKPTTNGKKEGTCIGILEEALSATSNSSFYKDIELISNWIWDWKLPEITETGLRKQMLSDYVETQNIYEIRKERDSSLNVNLRLFYHLRIRNFPCEITDFKNVSCIDSLKYHQKMFDLMSEGCGLNKIVLI